MTPDGPWYIYVCPVHGHVTPTMLGDCPIGNCPEPLEYVTVTRADAKTVPTGP